MFKVKSFQEILAMTKQGIDEALAPIRARAVRAKATVEVSKLEERLVALEREIQEECVKQDINFTKVLDKIDEYELAQRRVTQFNKLTDDLFPSAK